jgi:ketosteroid isomerase-like protein
MAAVGCERNTGRTLPGEKEIEELATAVGDALTKQDPDALRALADPDFEFQSRFMAVEGRVYRGPNAFRDYFHDIDDSFADPRWSLDEVVGGQGDDVMVVFRFTAHGRESGTPVDVLSPQVWSFRDGKVWRNVVYGSRAEALEAVGLKG